VLPFYWGGSSPWFGFYLYGFVLLGIFVVTAAYLSQQATTDDRKTSLILALCCGGTAFLIANDGYPDMGKIIDVVLGTWILTLLFTSIFWRAK